MNKELKISELEIKELKKINKFTEENIQKIKSGYPVQYLIGYVDFYGLKIKINENTLIPRYETEYLVEKLIKYIKKYNFEKPKILDMCTGSGCIGLALKKELPYSTIDLTDISKEALIVAELNKKDLNLDVKITQSDLWANIKENDFDIIVSNPPYVMKTETLSKTVLYEPHQALYSDNNGTYHIEQILKQAKNHLKNKFIIALEINEKSESDIKKIIEKYFNNKVKYTFENDLAGKTRYLFILNCV
jgi:release factor glutamine methyltransferase